MNEWYFIVLALVIGFLIGFIYGKHIVLSNRHGKITVDEGIDDKAGLYMEFYVDYDTLFKQRCLVFDFENNLSKK